MISGRRRKQACQKGQRKAGGGKNIQNGGRGMKNGRRKVLLSRGKQQTDKRTRRQMRQD